MYTGPRSNFTAVLTGGEDQDTDFMHRTDGKLDQPANSVVADDESSILRLAIEFARRGESSTARRLLLAVCEKNPDSEMAWLWRASLATNATEGLEYLTQVLRINPANGTALDWLEKLRLRTAAPSGRRRLALPVQAAAIPVQPQQQEAEADRLAKIERAEFAARFAQSQTAEVAGPVVPEPVLTEAERVAETRRVAAELRLAEARRIAEVRRLSESDPASDHWHSEEDRKRQDGLRVEEAKRYAEARRLMVSRRVAEARKIEEQQRRSIEERAEAEARWKKAEDERVLRAVEQLISEAEPEPEPEPQRGPESAPAPAPAPVAEAQTSALVPVVQTRCCPICSAPNDQDQCRTCHAIVSPENLTQFALNHRINRSQFWGTIDEWTPRAGQAEAEAVLLIANLNLLRYAQATKHLRELVKLNPLHPLVQQGTLLKQLAQPVVMAVDDSVTIRDMIASTVGNSGFTPLPLASPDDVIATMMEERPALVLMDIMMPGIDGHEVCRRIRKNKVLSQTPVVMLSGRDGLIDKMKGKLCGATGYLTKPSVGNSLVASLRQYLRMGDVVERSL